MNRFGTSSISVRFGRCEDFRLLFTLLIIKDGIDEVKLEEEQV